MSEDSGLRTQLLLAMAENVRELESKFADLDKRLSELGIEDSRSAADLKRLMDEIELKIEALQSDKITLPQWMRAFGREWPKALALFIIAAILGYISGFIEWVQHVIK